MKKIVREGVEPQFLELLMSGKKYPDNVQSANIRDFIEKNKEFLNKDNVYFEYHSTKDGDTLEIYLVAPVETESVHNLDPKLVYDPCRTPEESSLLGPSQAFILQGSSSLKESRKSMGKKSEEDAFGWEARRNQDPRKILEAIIRNNEVTSYLRRHDFQIRSVKQTYEKGLYDLTMTTGYWHDPVVAAVRVNPTSWEVGFGVAFYPQDNNWCERDFRADGEVDPDRPGTAVRTLDKVIPKAIREMERWS